MSHAQKVLCSEKEFLGTKLIMHVPMYFSGPAQRENCPCAEGFNLNGGIAMLTKLITHAPIREYAILNKFRCEI